MDHSRTRTKRPQTNGICERFHKTMLDEFYRVAFRKKIYATIDELQADLDSGWRVQRAGLIRAGGASERRQSRPSLTRSQSQKKNSWQDHNGDTRRLNRPRRPSDQVVANTRDPFGRLLNVLAHTG